MGSLRASDLDTNPELLETFVDLLVDGRTHKAIAEVLGVHHKTVGDWRKRPDVQAMMAKKLNERAGRILRHVDTRIEKKLEATPKMGMDQLLRIRREFAGATVNVNAPADKTGALQELMQALHENPELAERIGKKADEQTD